MSKNKAQFRTNYLPVESQKTVIDAAKISTEILWGMRERVEPGINGEDINTLTAELCKKHGVVPGFYGVQGNKSSFPGNLCLSVNDEVLHGIPNASQKINKGDLVKLDFGIIYQDYYTDQCVTVGVGEVSEADHKLLNIGKLAVEAGVGKAKTGNSSQDVGSAIQTVVELAGFNVIKEFVGHGIGKSLHLPPELPAYYTRGYKELLKERMVICVEAQIVAGSDKIYTESNGWTIKTVDGERSVMFEYMLLLENGKTTILTDTREWSVIKR